MSNHLRLLEIMKQAVLGSGASESYATGDFNLNESNKAAQLYSGSVYGFAVSLNQQEKEILFEEAILKGLSRLQDIEEFKPIENDFYPLYWGKDKKLGARPYQHLDDPKGTGSIRLSAYKSLLGKSISCVVLIVSDNALAEKFLQHTHPSLLKTTTRQFHDTQN